MASWQLFRRVKPVIIAESAGRDLAALAVEAVSKNPCAVIFPSRYLEGAYTYKENHENIPVIVAGTRNPRPNEEANILFIVTDTVQDMYRAGIFAAFLAQEDRILVFSDGMPGAQYIEAFREGLRLQNYPNPPSFYDISQENFPQSDIGCVVLTGPAANYLEIEQGAPIILFSWLDPAQFPGYVKLLFDDSPWAFASKAYKSLSGNEYEVLIPSDTILLPNKNEKQNFRNISELLKLNLQNN
ncbi:MAG: hypothetical protein FWH35_06195, partial [Treponema sp.]|nr:hypothetical protein [Treponema sp.]